MRKINNPGTVEYHQEVRINRLPCVTKAPNFTWEG